MDTSKYDANEQLKNGLFEWLVRIPFLFGALWSIGASIYLLLTPQTIHEQSAVSSPGSSEMGEEIIRQVSWYEAQGLWGVLVLVIFAIVFTVIGIFVLRKSFKAAAVISLLAVILVFLAGFSIGPLYLPAVLGVVVGWGVLGLTRLLGAKENAPG